MEVDAPPAGPGCPDPAALRPSGDDAGPGRVRLNLHHGKQGIGSASYGPALSDRYRLPVRRSAWSMMLGTMGRGC
ncbi:hypothetical protein ETD86_13620 [Nonomuraea turkmeniaca]|uniref:Uncharacterized protein n=1 Tax=Nonomuraea turkmeniaca TaxID=103838 RepID=A0A5S4FME2_9ACTN|nr:hypothetical protein [Nonomuraea turkmeniaca]TMR21833.1 hypothetical protein ETD86_13620 [Nonomuraea turkmeniaca]